MCFKSPLGFQVKRPSSFQKKEKLVGIRILHNNFQYNNNETLVFKKIQREDCVSQAVFPMSRLLKNSIKRT